MAKELTYNELLQENLELRQTFEELRKYYRKLSEIATTVYDRMKLTDEERDALKEISDWNDGVSETHLVAVRNLLERTKDND
jgi:hypothetical protein